jgi:hypothetical protein
MIPQNASRITTAAAEALAAVERPSAYDTAKLLIEHHATLDFGYSWATYKSGWEVCKTSLTYGQPILPFALPQQGWELIERPVLSMILANVSAPIEQGSGVAPRVQMAGRMDGVDKRLNLLRFLGHRELSCSSRPDLPFAGHWEVARLPLAVVPALITRADEDIRLQPLNEIETIDFQNCLNFLKVQLPSTHRMYLLPSQLVPEEGKQLERLALALGSSSNSSSTG